MATARSRRFAEFVAQGEDALRFLTPREEKIVKMIAEGKVYKEIVATKIARSESSVRRLAAKAERKLKERNQVEQPPKNRRFVLLRIFPTQKEWGSEVKCEIVAQGTKEHFLELYPPSKESPGMQLWVNLLGIGPGTYLFFEEQFDVAPGSYEECGDPRFI